jgi:hypothetical protein
MRINNADLARAIEIQETIQGLEIELKAIKEKCQEVGTFSTQDFVVVVKDCQRESAPGLAVLRDRLGDAFKRIQNDIKLVSYKTVSIKRKGA